MIAKFLKFLYWKQNINCYTVHHIEHLDFYVLYYWLNYRKVFPLLESENYFFNTKQK